MPPLLETRPLNLFIGVFPTGLTYCDRSRQEHGDYKLVAFLPFSTLRLEVRDAASELLPYIQADAESMASKRGQKYQISTAGQFIILGE